jgi:serine/threonine protein kinase
MLVGPWVGCLVSALAWIHAQRVKHKDIKPSNILIHGTNPVIADMGISHGFDNDSKSSGPSAGSPTYRAPEIIEQQIRGRRQDVWSMLLKMGLLVQWRLLLVVPPIVVDVLLLQSSGISSPQSLCCLHQQSGTVRVHMSGVGL